MILPKLKIKSIFIIFTLLFAYTFFCAFTYANTTFAKISDSVFRLHVIAASDSEEDQNLKYLVRDKVISYIDSILSNTQTKEDAMHKISASLSDLQSIAQQAIYENGFDYIASIEMGSSYFPTKYYGDVSLPNGYYDCLKIKIGKAEGQNWWCVLFPPLCFVDVSSGIVPESSKEIMKDNLSNEEYSLISEVEPAVKFKFKLLELFNIENTQTAKK